MLRKYVGHKQVAFAMWQHDLPTGALSRSGLLQSAHLKNAAATRADVAAMVDFFIAVGNAECARQGTDEHATALRKSGSFLQNGLTHEDRRSRSELDQIKADKKRGAQLARQRDVHGWASLSAAEQHALEEFETGELDRLEAATKRTRGSGRCGRLRLELPKHY